MGKQSSRRNKSERRYQNAFELAQKQEARDKKGAHSDEDYDSLDEEDLQVREGVMDARKFLKNQDDLSDLDDEDLDSDEALGSDDDFDVLNSKFSQTIRDKQKNNKRGKMALNEANSEDDEDGGYSSIDESQLVTLSEAWDMDDRERAKAGKSEKGAGGSHQHDIVLDDASASEGDHEDQFESAEGESEEEDSESESGSESESESEDEEAILRGSDEDEDEDVDLADTASRVKSSLKSTKANRRLVNDKREESEFALPTGGEGLSLADMIGGADVEDAFLIDKDEGLNAAMAVPLPKRIQQRHDRKAAYDITKKEVNKWRETVNAIQNSDHLSFPLAPPAQKTKEEDVDAEAMVDSFTFVPEAKGTSELEQKVNGLLKAGALVDESKEATFEQIQASKLSKEEMFKRTQELRRMRELMFRDEQRAKRIKKIKSKQYRKIHKRERLRDAALVEGSDAEEEDPDEHDMKRAEERMSQRHKTQSRWAKSMIKSGISKDASSRAELEDMLRDGERLRERKLGYTDGDQSDENVSDIEREYERDGSRNEDALRLKLGKGVMAMDFMKQAEERRKRENMQEIEFLKNVNSGTGLEEFSGNGEVDKTSINTAKNAGRRVYAPTVAAEKEELEQLDEELIQDYRDEEELNLANQMRGKERKRVRAEDGDEGEVSDVDGDDSDKGKTGDDGDSDDEDEEDDDNNNGYGPPAKKHKVEQQDEFAGFSESGSDKSDEGSDDDDDGDDDDGANPWLAMDDTEPTEKSRKFSTVDKDSSRLSKAASKIEKHKQRKTSGKDVDSKTLIDMGKTLDVQKKSNNIADDSDDDDDDEDADSDSGTRMFRQQNLIKEAFAGDDVVSEFQSEKQRIVEAEDDKEEDLTLPGWGDWAGSDAPKKPKKKFVRKIDGVAQKDKRKDKDKENVIINERLNRHNLKFQSASVPYPYETREQYERALRMPIGEEWASKATFEKSIKPRVEVKQGVIVDPLNAPFK